MLRFLKDGIHWAKSLDRFAASKFEEARLELESIQGSRKNYSEYLALLATVNIALMNDRIARDMLLKAINGSQPRKPEYREYIDIYCKYYISAIDGNESSKAKYLKEALRSPAPSIIKQWLPLS